MVQWYWMTLFPLLILSTLLTLESVPAFISASKIKALLEVGQELYYKNSTAQGQVLIKKRTWIPY